MDERSSRAEVRNPVLALPAAKRLRALDAPVRHSLRELFLEIQADARVKADKCWRKHKWPMAVYWKGVAVYTGHIARAIGRSTK